MKKNLSRRKFNQGLISTSFSGVAATIPTLSYGAWELTSPLDWFQNKDTHATKSEKWLSAQGRNNTQYSIGWINPNNKDHSQALTSFRGHGLCQNPIRPDQVIMFSRRPGTHGIRLSTKTNKINATFDSAEDRYMQGHGCYSADGKLLFSTESSISSGKGKITVRDAETLERINEFDSHGIGPHEIKLMPDGQTLVVANGGLLTHPDSGREILNLDTMRSSLNYIDSRNGELISEHFLSESKASIRHIDVSTDGMVAIALQVQRKAMDNNELIPLAAIHRAGLPIQTLNAPDALMTQLNDYMGSVIIHNASRIAAFTSPKGDLAMFWHLDDLSLQGYHAFHDVCGLTISQDNKYFILSNSAGKIRQIDTRTLKESTRKRMKFHNVSWDNHMISTTLTR